MTTRADRVLPGIAFSATLVGAVHTVESTISMPREWFGAMTDEEIEAHLREIVAEVEAERDS